VAAGGGGVTAAVVVVGVVVDVLVVVAGVVDMTVLEVVGRTVGCCWRPALLRLWWSHLPGSAVASRGTTTHNSRTNIGVGHEDNSMLPLSPYR